MSAMQDTPARQGAFPLSRWCFLSANAATNIVFCLTGPFVLPTYETMRGAEKKHHDVVDKVRSLLASRGMSLAELSRRSRERFPTSRRFQIAPNFYDLLRRPSFSPSLYQIYALSNLTQDRIADWLSVFGFAFDDAATFQASFSQMQTVELESHIYDPAAEVVWFRKDVTPVFGDEPAPLSDWLSGDLNRTLASLSTRVDSSFRYLKIGARDAYAFPDLLPGSIVRVNSRTPPSRLIAGKTKPILAVAVEGRIFCGVLQSINNHRVVLRPKCLSYPPKEWKLGSEATILGQIDMELRFLDYRQSPEVPAHWRNRSRNVISKSAPNSGGIGALIRLARVRCGLSLKEASQRTRLIARALHHERYFCATATLSDLESGELLARQIHKLISLSSVYCISLAELVRRAGLRLEGEGEASRPFQPRFSALGNLTTSDLPPSPFLEWFERQFQEIPLFLRNALPICLGLPNLSIHDFFWAGATQALSHPYLRNSTLFVIDSKIKIPTRSLSSSGWAQPVYLLQLRNERRLVAPCHLEDDTIIARPCAANFAEVLRLRRASQVEVLGKVVALVRRLPNAADQ